MNKTEINKNILIDELFKKIEQLEEENKDLKNEITDLKKNLTKTDNQNPEKTISLNIDIRLHGTKKYQFKPDDSINSMIESVKKDFTIYSNIILRYNNLLIDNYFRTFEEYKIPDNSTINFIHYKIGGEVYVKTVMGNTLTIYLEPFNTIEYLKQRIQDSTGIKSKDQGLIYDGKQLEDNRTVASYNIWNESTIHMVLRIR